MHTHTPCISSALCAYNYNKMATKIKRNSQQGKQTNNHIGKWDFKVQFAVWLYNVEYDACARAMVHYHLCALLQSTHTHTKKRSRLHTFVFGAINNKHTRANIITCNTYTDAHTHIT